MKGEVVRGRRTNTVTLVLPVIGSTERWCPVCKQHTHHGLLGQLLAICGLCNEVVKR